jgi:hypothetical protein
MKSRGRGVLVTPHARGMTSGCGAQTVTPHCERSEAIQGQGKTARVALDCFVALLFAMTALAYRALLFGMSASGARYLTRCVTAKRANYAASVKACPALRAKINRFALTPNQNLNYRRPGATDSAEVTIRTSHQ